MRNQVIDALDRLVDDDAVRAMVLTGAGSVFCAGEHCRHAGWKLEAPRGKVGVLMAGVGKSKHTALSMRSIISTSP